MYSLNVTVPVAVFGLSVAESLSVAVQVIVPADVVETVKPYVKRETAQREVSKTLKRYERRGTTARNKLERQIKRTRTQLERGLRQRRNKVTGLVKRNSRNLETTGKGATRDVRAGNFERAAERVQTGVVKTAEDVRTQVPTLV